MELAVSKIGQKVCHCFVLRYKNIKIVNSVQVQVARTREGVNILSNLDTKASRICVRSAVWKQRINYDEPSMSVSILFTLQDQQNVKFHCDEMPES